MNKDELPQGNHYYRSYSRLHMAMKTGCCTLPTIQRESIWKGTTTYMADTLRSDNGQTHVGILKCGAPSEPTTSIPIKEPRSQWAFVVGAGDVNLKYCYDYFSSAPVLSASRKKQKALRQRNDNRMFPRRAGNLYSLMIEEELRGGDVKCRM